MYQYSAQTNAFYPKSLHYPSLPADVIDVSEETFKTFSQAKEGFIRIAGNDGQPKWQTIVISLDEAKTAKCTEISHKRTEIELGGFEFNGVLFDSDRDSIQRISNAALAAQSAMMLHHDFKAVWTLKDNSTIELQAQEMIAVQRALVEHVTATHEKARILKDQVDAAATIKEVEAITW